MYNKRKEKKYAEVVEVVEAKTLTDKIREHRERHPNDNNTKKNNKGVIWRKPTEKDKQLKEFYKANVWTSFGSNGWVALPIEDEEQ
jgi:hypothetical protein|tara:strand:+ start:376 stop:633 length:258 start_codon:yes stop_codon:yes gene_type:complete